MGRKVPAHMPHMINVKIMEELQSLLPEEFDQTSSHKLRSSEDMQFAFSYNYFVIGQKKDPNVTEFFADVDADHSGVLNMFIWTFADGRTIPCRQTWSPSSITFK